MTTAHATGFVKDNALAAIPRNFKSDWNNLTLFPSAAKLKQVGLSDAQIAKEQRDYALNVAWTGALIGGGVAVGRHYGGTWGMLLGGLAGVALNYGRHRISLSL